MNRDDLTYSIPAFETEAERWEADDSPLHHGELGAGFLLLPEHDNGEPPPIRCGSNAPTYADYGCWMGTCSDHPEG